MDECVGTLFMMAMIKHSNLQRAMLLCSWERHHFGDWFCLVALLVEMHCGCSGFEHSLVLV